MDSNNQLVELYSIDNDTFAIGYILAASEQYILFQSINEYGFVDGFSIRHRDSIIDVFHQSPYIDLYTSFFTYNRQHQLADPYDLLSTRSELTANMEDMLAYCLKRQHVISLAVDGVEEVLLGRLVAIDKEVIIFNVLQVEDWLELDKQIIYIADILVLEIQTIENKLINWYIQTNGKG